MFKTVREKKKGVMSKRGIERESGRKQATKIGQDAGRKVKKERRER